MAENPFLTVSQLNGHIKEVLNMGFPSGVWVCGEIQGYDRNKNSRSPHSFFDLCEKDPTTKDVVAKIGLIIFASRKPQIEEILRQAQNAFQLKDDIEVKFFCRVDFYPPHGSVRLIVESIDPIYTLGKIAQEKQRLIALLQQKGTLDKNKKTALGLVPLNIGLITAYDSAAYNDFIAELRSSRYGFRIFCRNTLMQGKSAGDDVCKAIGELNKISFLDAIVITRGGGSIAELSCFDNQAIAEKIAASPLPILSGIGHEINITITDLAAHTYQKTPTAIAQFLVGRIHEYLILVEEKIAVIIDSAKETLADKRQYLKNTAHGLHHSTMIYLKEHHQGLARRQHQVRQAPLQALQRSSLKVTALKEIFLKDLSDRFKTEQLRLKNFTRMIEIVHPRNTLKRGFSITRLADGKLLRSVRQVEIGKEMITSLVDGSVKSSAIKINPQGAK